MTQSFQPAVPNDNCTSAIPSQNNAFVLIDPKVTSLDENIFEDNDADEADETVWLQRHNTFKADMETAEVAFFAKIHNRSSAA